MFQAAFSRVAFLACSLALAEVRCAASSIPDDGTVVNLTSDIRVQLRRGSRLRVVRSSFNGPTIVQLQGTCRFRVTPAHPASSDAQDLIIYTRGASIAAKYAEFQVFARGETTAVFVSDLPPVSGRYSDVLMARRSPPSPPVHIRAGMALRFP